MMASDFHQVESWCKITLLLKLVTAKSAVIVHFRDMLFTVRTDLCIYLSHIPSFIFEGSKVLLYFIILLDN